MTTAASSNKTRYFLRKVTMWLISVQLVTFLTIKAFDQSDTDAHSIWLPILFFVIYLTITIIIELHTHRIEINEDFITILKFTKHEQLNWNEIQKIKVLNKNHRESLFWIEPKKGKSFLTFSDKPKSEFLKSLKLSYHPKFETEMGKIIDQKKKELGI